MVCKHLYEATIIGIVLMTLSPGNSGAAPPDEQRVVVGADSRTGQQNSKSSGDENTVSQGHALFVQRCALCHLSPDGWRKSGLAPSIGPSLTGVLKDGSPEREAAVRERIRLGSQAMPGFQYGLDPQQLDRVIAYLKTLR